MWVSEGLTMSLAQTFRVVSEETPFHTKTSTSLTVGPGAPSTLEDGDPCRVRAGTTCSRYTGRVEDQGPSLRRREEGPRKGTVGGSVDLCKSTTRVTLVSTTDP